VNFSIPSIRNALISQLAGVVPLQNDLFSFTTTHLPMGFIQFEEITASPRGLGFMWNLRITVNVVTSPVAQNIRSEQREKAEDLLELCMGAIMQDITLSGTVDQVSRCTSPGFQVLTISGVDYLGFRVSLEVIIK